MIATLALLLTPTLAPSELVVEPFDCPAPPRSGNPALTRGGDGALYLSWLGRGEGRDVRFSFARHADGAWSEPRTVVESGQMFRNWTDLPSVTALADGTLAATWLENKATRGYGARVVTSTDGGETWTQPVWLHDSEKGMEHGFVSLFPLDATSFGAVWLDGRDMRGAGKGQTGVYYRTVGADGKLGKEAVLDSRVCDCCPTGAAIQGDRGLALFRDRSRDEVRDIAFARFTGGKWSKSKLVADDGWEIQGCPVNGPAVTFAGDRAAAIWFTGGGARGGNVRLAFSAHHRRGQPRGAREHRGAL
jgi:hypothetical protein